MSRPSSAGYDLAESDTDVQHAGAAVVHQGRGRVRSVAGGLTAMCAAAVVGTAVFKSYAGGPVRSWRGVPLSLEETELHAAIAERARARSSTTSNSLLRLDQSLDSKGSSLCPGWTIRDCERKKFPLPYLPGEYPTEYTYNGSFPAGFIWGMGTAAYQVEGSYKKDGRGASIWDTFSGANTVGMPGNNCSYCCQTAPCPVNAAMADKGATGNVACDHYNMWKTDISLMKAMGLKYYRFSISWPRIIPTGKLADGVNQAGIDFYNNLINGLIQANITPFVTLYHWDLPQGLLNPPTEQAWWSRDQDGNPDGKIMKDWLDYVTVCFSSFGDRIKDWVTFNEPWTFVFLGSGYGKAPSIEAYADMDTDVWIAAHNVLNAHAAAVDLYRRKFKPTQNGKISITVNSDWREPMFNTMEDIATADRAQIVRLGWFAEPIFGTCGDYPPELKILLGDKLPKFTHQQKQLLKGSSDFFGLNHYAAEWATFDPTSKDKDYSFLRSSEDGFVKGQSAWLYSCPWGFRKILNWVKNRYNNPPTIVTENGWSWPADTPDEGAADSSRLMYYANYTSEMLKAIVEDGVNVTGYFAWSVMDNYEWEQGYKQRFGVVYNDYQLGPDPNGPLPLTPQPTEGQQWRRRKDSSCWLETVFRTNSMADPNDQRYRCTCHAVFEGEFLDAKKCPRTISLNGTNVTITGKDPNTKVMCDGTTDKPWAAQATGFVSGGSIVVDFSAAGGSPRLGGFWDASVAAGAIHWGDGAAWTAVTHGTCPQDKSISQYTSAIKQLVKGMTV